MLPSKAATGSVAQTVANASRVTRTFWVPPMAQLLRELLAALETDSKLDASENCWKSSATGKLLILAKSRITVTDLLEKAENLRQPLIFALRQWSRPPAGATT